MRNQRAHLILTMMVVLLGVITTSCAKLQEPSVSQARITGCDIKGLTSADVCFSFSINNPNKKNLSAESASGRISLSGSPVADFVLTGTPLVAPASSTSSISACVNLKITDPLSLVTAGINLRDPDLSQLTADVDIIVRIGTTPKKIRLRNAPLSSLVSYLKSI